METKPEGYTDARYVTPLGVGAVTQYGYTKPRSLNRGSGQGTCFGFYVPDVVLVRLRAPGRRSSRATPSAPSGSISSLCQLHLPPKYCKYRLYIVNQKKGHPLAVFHNHAHVVRPYMVLRHISILSRYVVNTQYPHDILPVYILIFSPYEVHYSYRCTPLVGRRGVVLPVKPDGFRNSHADK